MKPAEILGMVEEAAGTRMYEDRKDKAVKTMAKKDKKVEEIEAVSLRDTAGTVQLDVTAANRYLSTLDAS